MHRDLIDFGKLPNIGEYNLTCTVVKVLPDPSTFIDVTYELNFTAKAEDKEELHSRQVLREWEWNELRERIYETTWLALARHIYQLDRNIE